MDDTKRSRMEHQILEKISMMILSGIVKDPRVNSLLSVTRVQIANDLSFATVYISSIQQDSTVEKSVDALNHAAGFIQNQLGKTLKTRNTPRLKFLHDTSVRDSFHMSKILEGLKNKES